MNKMKKFLISLRNGAVVLVLLLSYTFITNKDMISTQDFFLALGISLAWTCLELIRLWNIKINGIVNYSSRPTLLLPSI